MTLDQAFARWASEHPFSEARIRFWDEYCDLRDGLPLGTTNTKKDFRGQNKEWADSARRFVRDDGLVIQN